MLNHYDFYDEDLKDLKTSPFWEGVRAFLTQLGANQKQINQAFYFVLEVESHARKLGITRTEPFQTYAENEPLYRHGLVCTMISFLITQAMGIEFKRAVQTIGIASLFHDIGLVSMKNLGKAFLLDDESAMSAEQRSIYRQHPRIAAEIFQKVAGIDPLVIQIVGQHHERRDGNQGFTAYPERSEATHVYSEVVGMSDELARFLDCSTSVPTSRLKESMKESTQQQSLVRGFSLTISKVCEDVFWLKSS